MTPEVSVVVVSFNTRDLLRECLTSLTKECEGVSSEIFVVDNVSRDGSADMVNREFPTVRLLRSEVNLGFAAANNRAFPLSTGRYVVLLNSDAFLDPGALRRSLQHMYDEPTTGLGGARLVGRDGEGQPSARSFPSPLNDLLTLTGLAARFPHSRFFGRFDRTWADQNAAADVDWVPGAFSIVRREVLDRIGYFDEAFFLYYEEVDLCRRIAAAGYGIRYWPDVTVVHLGGESSKTVETVRMSSSGSQLALWRMRSAFLYYRKHHGNSAWYMKQMEQVWHRLREWKNGDSAKGEESRLLISLLDRAWAETSGGAVSPSRALVMFENVREDWRIYDGSLSRQGLWVMLVYRFGRWRYEVKPRLLRLPFSGIYRCLKLLSQILTGIDLPCEAILGKRFCIEHFGGIVISGDAIFGDDCIIRNGVTVGLRRTGQRGAPVFGNRVDIGVGAVILGDIYVGDDVSIGANAVVLQDVPANSIAVGVPAQIRPKKASVAG